MAAPLVSGINTSLTFDQTVAASALFTASDPDGDPITRYELWDGGAGGGYFRIGTTQQSSGVAIPVSAAQLATTEYVGAPAASTETLWVRAYDGSVWSLWASLTARTQAAANVPPTLSAANRNIDLNQWRLLTELVSGTDADGDRITRYEIHDLTGTAGSGYLWGNGAAVAQGGGIVVSDLATTWVRGGAVGVVDTYEIRAFDGFAWSDWTRFDLTTRVQPNRAPMVTPTAATQTVVVGTAVATSTLFSVSDADGDAPTQYKLWDSAGLGYFRVGGVAQPAGQAILITADQLALTDYVGGSARGSETVWAMAYDGQAWSPAWASWTIQTVRANNAAPMVSAPSGNIDQNMWRMLSSFITTADADGDAIVHYQIRDLTATPGSGYIWANGAAQPASTDIGFTSLAEAWVRGGANLGVDNYELRAKDSEGAWSAWTPFTLTTRLPNRAPMVTPTAATQTVVIGTAVATSTLFSVSDADGDAPTQYKLWDSAGLGYFRVGGGAQPAGQAILISADQLALTDYVGGSARGSETVWAMAYDGQAWSPAWASWTMQTVRANNAAPTVTAPDRAVQPVGSGGEWLRLDSFVTTADADGDAIVQYELRDLTPAAGSGIIYANGQNQPQGATVSFASLATAWVRGAANPIPLVDNYEIRAKDGEGAWSAWEPFAIRTHRLPTVSAQNSKVGTDKSVPVTSLISAVDPDGDAIVRYQLWDSVGKGYFAVGGVAQPSGVGITVAASELADVTYVGASDVGAETVWARADDGGGAWGPWKDWTMDTVYRFDEVVGTTGDDVVATPNTDSVYFGLSGDDTFNVQADKDPFVVGGAGNDTYTVVSGTGIVAIAETGNSSADQLNSNIPFGSLGAATVDGRRHLVLEDIKTGNVVVQFDWQSPANRIETYTFPGYGSVPYSLMERVIFQSNAPVLTWEQLGYSTYYLNEAIAYYAQREQQVLNPPVVSTFDHGIRSGDSIPLSSLISATDPDGDPIAQYEVFMGYNSPQPGYITVNGVPDYRQTVTIQAADFAQARYVSAAVPGIEHYLTVRAYAFVWSAPANLVVTTTINQAPVAQSGSGTGLAPGQAELIAPLVSAADPDGDPIAAYEFTQDAAALVHGALFYDGVLQATGVPLQVPASDLNKVVYIANSVDLGLDRIGVRASDGEAWGDQSTFAISNNQASDRAPRVEYSVPVFVGPGSAVIPVASLFRAVDPDGEAITRYRFYDHSGGGGYFTVNGVEQPFGFEIDASQLAQTAFVMGSTSDSYSVEAFDGSLWGGAGGGPSSTARSALQPPAVVAADLALAPGRVVAASSLFSVSNPAGGTIRTYVFVDEGSDPESGHFVFRGVEKGPQAVFAVDAPSLGDLTYVAGTAGQLDNISVRMIYDLPDLPTVSPASPWAQFSVVSGARAADGAGNDLAAARAVSVGNSPTTYRDALHDADPVDYYRFTLGDTAQVLVGLTGLSANADLALLDNVGAALANSTYPDRESETLSRTLAAGTYYVRVMQSGGADTQYALTLAAV